MWGWRALTPRKERKIEKSVEVQRAGSPTPTQAVDGLIGDVEQKEKRSKPTQAVDALIGDVEQKEKRSPRPTQAVDAPIGDVEQKEKIKTVNGHPTQLPWTIRSSPTTRMDHIVRVFPNPPLLGSRGVWGDNNYNVNLTRLTFRGDIAPGVLPSAR